MQTLTEAVRKNRERDIRLLEQAAAKATARGNYFRKQAQAIANNPKGYLDPQGEVTFMMACAQPFNETANDARAKAAALRAQLEVA